MASIDQSKPPYYNRYDKNKNYTKVLFKPDKPLQQAELNELQSQIGNQLKGIGDGVE